jgi:hypothetical protein
MGDFLYGGGGGQKVVVYSGLQVSTSQLDVAIPWMRGQRRLGINAIWYNDFKKHKQSAKGKGGGKGSGQYTYSASVILGLCYGPVDSILNCWSQGSTSTVTTLTALGFSLATGTAAQAPWSYVVTAHPSEALAYPNIANLFHQDLDCGSSASIPNNEFETKLCPYADVFVSNGYKNPETGAITPGADVNMADFMPDLLNTTAGLGGMGMPVGYVPDVTEFRTYQAAQGLFFSPYLKNQEKCTDVLDRWAKLANCWFYDSGTQLEIVCLGDAALTANGYTYTPDLSVQYNFDAANGDFLSNPPVEVQIKPQADAKNRFIVSITDRTMGYVTNPKEYKVGSLIRRYGRKDGDQIQGDEICCPAVGDIVVQLNGKRESQILKTYKWQTHWRFKRLLPGCIVTLTDTTQDLTLEKVRITDIEEDDSGALSFTAEELPGNVGAYNARPSQPGPISTVPNLLADPGNVNTPAVVELAQINPGDNTKVLIAASGGVNWGGCEVWLSFDSTNYTNVDRITAPAIQGVLTAPLAAYGGVNPDTGHTLSVDCTISGGEPEPVTHADAAALRTLSLVCAPPTVSGSDLVLDSAGELLAFGNTAATGTNTADLTYHFRGDYGTSPGAHATNDLFSLFDLSGQGSTIAYTLPAQYVGQPIYIKLASFNIFGKATQDLSVCQSYKYTPTGLGFGGGAGGVPTTPSIASAVASGPQQVTVTLVANPATDNVTVYEIYRAPGLGASFGASALVAVIAGLSFTDTTVSADSDYTYFAKAENVIGLSAASAGVSITSDTTVVGRAGAAFTCQHIETKALNAVLCGYSAVDPWTQPSVAHGGYVEGWVDNAPIADTDFDILAGGVSVGTARWAAGSHSPTLIKASDTFYLLGGRLDIKLPANLNGMSGVWRLSVPGTR